MVNECGDVYDLKSFIKFKKKKRDMFFAFWVLAVLSIQGIKKLKLGGLKPQGGVWEVDAGSCFNY